ncbi:hypothetical protein H8692_05685 [Mogibacterium sp. NSJ-24]|jgi:microcystin-dependent protein|uniref:Baseplate structural protein Gp10 C-terminal domain-containing protein n=1 Tax=Lentihominibacter hominis TaxID=2763645 RepID=A0A926E8C9_9FIRM|nr:hypothetical protein [Lentihominibacter hominis]MBC8568255.1 hypothetical protein [Lentihominibacter hominis]
MSIQSEINRISGNIDAAFSAIEAQGTPVPEGSNSNDLAALIAQAGDLSERAVLLEPQNVFNGGEDLNDFKMCGNWLCTNDVIATSLKNCPEGLTDVASGIGGFQLRVLATTNSVKVQELIPFSGQRWHRYYNGDTWSEWTKDYNAADTIPITNGGTGARNAAAARANIGACSLDDVYPVGSIYFAYNHTSPASIFGGSWTRISSRFLYGVTASQTIGSTGGEAEHLLTSAEMPSHSHTFTGTATSAGAHTHTVSGTAASAGSHNHSVPNTSNGINGSAVRAESWANASDSGRTLSTGLAGVHTHDVSGTATSKGAHTHTVTGNIGNAGSDAAHNNMPPYINVSIWRRTG